MPTMEEFCERIGERLGLDSSYLESDIPSSVGRCMKRLLRDYNFPKSIRKQLWEELGEGSQAYSLPADFKRELLLVFQAPNSDGVSAFSEALRKAEGFVLPQSDGAARAYWIEGTTLWTDVVLGSGNDDTTLVMVYQSNGLEHNQAWMLADLEDVLFSLCMFRLASEFSKPELANVYAALWVEDQRSLAIYLNELEFSNLNMVMRELPTRLRERYPVS